MMRYPLHRWLMLPSVIILSFLFSFSCSKSDFSHKAHIVAGVDDCSVCHGSDRENPKQAEQRDCSACHDKGEQYSVRDTLKNIYSESPGATFFHKDHKDGVLGCVECHEVERQQGFKMTIPDSDKCGECHEEEIALGSGPQ